MKLAELSAGQLWALKTCLKVLDVLTPEERVAVPLAIIEAHITGLSLAAAKACDDAGLEKR